MLECAKCHDKVPDAEQRGEGFSFGALCRHIDCDGVYLDEGTNA